MPNERRSSNYGRDAAKIAHYNSVISEIAGKKAHKLVHDIVGLLPFNHFAVASRLSNPLSNARANSRFMATSANGPQFLTRPSCHNNVPLATLMSDYPSNLYSYQIRKFGPGYSEIFGVIADFCRIAAKVITFNIVNSEVTGPNLITFLHNAEKFMPFHL